MRCTNPLILKNNQVVACGQCMACRITRTSAWTARLTTELSSWRQSAFVTLTYDDEHLPKDKSLHKEELQKFLKRFRKNYDYPVKYYACGEYGEDEFSTHRCHYHLILFGCGTDMYSRTIIQKSWTKCNPEKFLIPEFKGVGTVTPYSIRYVAGYVQKKLTGPQGKQAYLDYGLEPPFQLSSQRLGLKWAEEHREQLLNENGYNLVSGLVPVPKYIRDKLELPSHQIDVTVMELDYLREHGWSEESLKRLSSSRLVHFAYNEEKNNIEQRANKNTLMLVKDGIK